MCRGCGWRAIWMAAERATVSWQGASVAPGTNPTVRQRELGRRLRELRVQRGLTLEEVADKLLCSVTKMPRLETGARRASLRNVRDLCAVHGAHQSTSAELTTISRGTREQVGGLSMGIST